MAPQTRRVKLRQRRRRLSRFAKYSILSYNIVALIGRVYIMIRSLRRGSYPSPLGALSDLDLITKLEIAAFLEVLHALLDVVRKPVPRRPKRGPYSDFVTSLQICMRNIIIWGVLRPNPIIMLGSNRPVFLGCLLAWGCSDCLRYLYVIVLLVSGTKPDLWKQWRRVRYIASVVFYFVGYMCELFLVLIASNASRAYRASVSWGIVLFALQNFFTYTLYLYRDLRYWG